MFQDLPLLLRASDFAARKHASQRRKDPEQTPYINHPIAVAQLLAAEAGVHDVRVLCAAVLHDTIEDTDTTAAEIHARFGADVAALVVELSDDPTQKKRDRKQRQIDTAATASHRAKLIKLADKTCNLRDMSVAWPRGWERDRVIEYFLWADAVVAQIGPVHPILWQLYSDASGSRPPE